MFNPLSISSFEYRMEREMYLFFPHPNPLPKGEGV